MHSVLRTNSHTFTYIHTSKFTCTVNFQYKSLFGSGLSRLGFDKLFNYYFNSLRKIIVTVYSKSYLSNFNDSVMTDQRKNIIKFTQTNDNYFILFNNGKNVKFENSYFKKGKLIFISINKQEVKDRIYFTFSNGNFYKL